MERNNDLISRSALLKELEWLKANVNESSKAEVEEYIQRVKNAPAATEKPQWIPATEPPKERGMYLCYYKFEPESPDVICENTYRGLGRWMSETDKVTHWMPLPEPPKEE